MEDQIEPVLEKMDNGEDSKQGSNEENVIQHTSEQNEVVEQLGDGLVQSPVKDGQLECNNVPTSDDEQLSANEERQPIKKDEQLKNNAPSPEETQLANKSTMDENAMVLDEALSTKAVSNDPIGSTDQSDVTYLSKSVPVSNETTVCMLDTETQRSLSVSNELNIEQGGIENTVQADSNENTDNTAHTKLDTVSLGPSVSENAVSACDPEIRSDTKRKPENHEEPKEKWTHILAELTDMSPIFLPIKTSARIKVNVGFVSFSFLKAWVQESTCVQLFSCNSVIQKHSELI